MGDSLIILKSKLKVALSRVEVLEESIGGYISTKEADVCKIAEMTARVAELKQRSIDGAKLWGDKHMAVVEERNAAIERVAVLEGQNSRHLVRVACLLYILARDHLPFGTINDVIRDHARGVGVCVYSSAGGEAMVRSMVDELLRDPEQTGLHTDYEAARDAAENDEEPCK